MGFQQPTLDQRNFVLILDKSINLHPIEKQAAEKRSVTHYEIEGKDQVKVAVLVKEVFEDFG